MALTKRQVAVFEDATIARNVLHVMPATAQVPRKATIIATQTPGTLAVTEAGVANKRVIIDKVGVGANVANALAYIYVSNGTGTIEHYLQTGGVLDLNLACATGTTASASVSAIQSYATALWMTTHTVDLGS